MTEFLLFTLYAPLTSWGDITVGESRSSWDRPSRSAVLGILAAALGITRDDQDGHDALDQGYGFAVRLDAGGSSLIDYQTAQTAAEPEIKKTFGKGERPRTRRELLSVAERQTILSRRELREDALATACLWTQENPRWSLADLANALKHPAFMLYAGRKANVFGLPLAPEIISAETLAAAFAAKVPERPALEDRRIKSIGKSWGREVAHDIISDDLAAGLTMARTEVRRDTHAHRRRWQFAERAVTISLLPVEAVQ
jgi:CRISPR system Cascade subunit CasD